MPPALLLSLAIVAEVVATLALRESDGFSRPLPSALVVLGYAAAFGLLSFVLRSYDVGFVYAIWAGAGTALIAIAGIVAFGEPASALKLASVGLVVVGVVGINLAGGAH